MKGLLVILLIFVVFPSERRASIHSTSADVLICRSLEILRETYSQKDFQNEWIEYSLTFYGSDTSDIFDKWYERAIGDTIINLSEKSETNMKLSIDTIFFTDNRPTLAYPYNVAVIDARSILNKAKKIYYQPTESWILSDDDILKKTTFKVNVSNIEKCLKQELNSPETELKLNVFISSVYSNNNFDVIELGLIYSKYWLLNPTEKYSSGNILGLTIYMSKDKADDYRIRYSQSLGLRPTSIDTLVLSSMGY